MPLTFKPTKLDYVLDWLWFVILYFLIKWLGWILGICGIILLWEVYRRVAAHFFGLEHLNGLD